MKLVQLKNHRENKQTVQSVKHSIAGVGFDRITTKVRRSHCRNPAIPAARQSHSVSIRLVPVENSEGSACNADLIPSSPGRDTASPQFLVGSGLFHKPFGQARVTPVLSECVPFAD
jgi:hypothetical protein